MSSVGDALSGSTGASTAASGVSDSTFSDATLGSQITGGSDLFSPDATASDAGGGGFNSLTSIANALSGGGTSGTGTSSVGAQSAAMTPPSAAATTGGDPTGAAGGTQSATAPGSTPATQTQQQQQQTQPRQDDGHAPQSAVAELAKLLKGLQGKPTGPTAQVPQPQQPAPFVLPTMARRETGPPSSPNLSSLWDMKDTTPGLPTLAPGETGRQSPQASGWFPNEGGIANLPELQKGETGPPSPTEPQTDADGNPLTVAGTRADQTPLPPSRPTDTSPDAPSTTGGKPTPTTDDQGRVITVKKTQPKTATADLPTKVPLPTHKGGPEAAPAPQVQPPPSRLIQDITGRSTGVPTGLGELVQAAMALAPLIGMFMGGGRGGRGGRFHGGRFTHGVPGGFSGFRGGRRAMAGGAHPPMSGPWPYHHPMHGWDMHHMHPGGGWRPLSHDHAQQLGLFGGGPLGGQDGQDPNQQDPNAPDPNRPPKEGGADPGPASDAPSGAIPGVSGKQVDDYTRQVAQKYMIDPDVASKVLAQESSYGQARRPGDNGTSFGPFQLHFAADGHAMGDEFLRDTGLDPRDPSTWKAQIDYAMMRASTDGWTPWTTTMKKLGMNQWSGITTNRRFAGQTTGNQQPKTQINISPTTLPVTSQPMVAG